MLSNDKEIRTFDDVFSANEITKAYPNLKDVKIIFGDKPGGPQAQYRETEKEIFINRSAFKRYFNEKGLLKDSEAILKETNNLRRLRGVFTHELAHYVQFREGFGIGGGTKQFTDL
ncbi:MAG: hypothetical protein RIG77_10025 [Cyclobacteriaceae bacterium]